ncbi:hypothetical protein BCEP27_130116 [Burkholderia cepacia]
MNRSCVVGCRMRTLTGPNRPSVAKAVLALDEAGRMKSPLPFDRVVDVLEERVKFTSPTVRRGPQSRRPVLRTKRGCRSAVRAHRSTQHPGRQGVRRGRRIRLD